jgi:uncharacterized protein YneF (UPF0154 family)
MDNQHTILKKYYSKYDKKGGNIASRIISKINPRLIMSLAKQRYPTMVQSIKTMIHEAGTDISERAIDEMTQNIAKEILQGNNPIQSFKDGIYTRLVENENLSPDQTEYFRKYLNVDSPPDLTPLKISNKYSIPLNLSPSISPYFSRSPTSSESSSSPRNELRGGSDNLYYEKYIKYLNKVI